ncbi:MAG TPA: FMN-binding negative transcriptional regulator [Acidimicrobiales bacterium]|nr:FMN-binding negative transcriptional regulator [Acidimicrobiales bacterium]
MYIAPVDASSGEAEWRPFVESQGFGHLVAAGRGRDVPVVVPTQFVLDGATVLCHFAARNPVFAALAENRRVLLSVAGDWAFIPSAWKAVTGEDPLLGIPTTYYGAVQLVGDATVVTGADELAALLRVQLAALQPEVAVADPADAHRDRLGLIHGVRVTVDDVRAKFKYGGNVDEEHRLAVVAELHRRGGPGDAAAAVHTLRRLEAGRG